MNQLSITFARQQADRGMAAAEGHANRVTPAWSALALAFLRRYASKHSERFTAEDVLEAADEWGMIAPPDSRAWGATFKRAAKIGLIRKDGFAVCRKRHCSPTVAWQSRIFGSSNEIVAG